MGLSAVDNLDLFALACKHWLLQQHHFLGLRPIVSLQTIEINPRRQSRAVENNGVTSGRLHFIRKRCHFPSQEIEDRQRHMAGLAQVVGYLRDWIERIRPI